MFKWQISAGQLAEAIRPVAFLCAALISTWTLADARQRQCKTHVVALWTAATLAFPFITFPLYLIARSLNCGLRIADCGLEDKSSFNPQSAIPNPQSKNPHSAFRIPQSTFPLLYLLTLIILGVFYFYIDYRTFDAHLARAAAAKLHHQRARAINEYRTALRLKDDPHTHKLLGLELAAEENHAEALAELRAAEQGGEPDALLPYQLAITLDALGRTDEAVAAYRKFLQSELCAQPFPDLRCVESRLRARQQEKSAGIKADEGGTNRAR